jgi:hypothetical protein
MSFNKVVPFRQVKYYYLAMICWENRLNIILNIDERNTELWGRWGDYWGIKPRASCKLGTLH